MTLEITDRIFSKPEIQTPQEKVKAFIGRANYNFLTRNWLEDEIAYKHILVSYILDLEQQLKRNPEILERTKIFSNIFADIFRTT